MHKVALCVYDWSCLTIKFPLWQCRSNVTVLPLRSDTWRFRRKFHIWKCVYKHWCTSHSKEILQTRYYFSAHTVFMSHIPISHVPNTLLMCYTRPAHRASISFAQSLPNSKSLSSLQKQVFFPAHFPPKSCTCCLNVGESCGDKLSDGYMHGCLFAGWDPTATCATRVGEACASNCISNVAPRAWAARAQAKRHVRCVSMCHEHDTWNLSYLHMTAGLLYITFRTNHGIIYL